MSMSRLLQRFAWLNLCCAVGIIHCPALAFSGMTTTHTNNGRTNAIPTLLKSFHYARGADIWPECNPDPIQLQDSFPNGHIPYSAILEVDQTDMQAVHEDTSNAMEGEGTNLFRSRRHKARFIVSKTVQRLLRRAAAKEELQTEEGLTNPSWQQTLRDRLVILLAGVLVLQGFVRPVDVLVVAALTSYYIILGMIARSPRQGGLAPIMPSMPPQGHVPTMLSHPLGMGVANNRSYDSWLQAGVGLGIILPVLSMLFDRTVLRRSFTRSLVATRVCARPLFLLCCQVVSETNSKRAMSPLPIRILIPISYNVARLTYLWNWAACTVPLGAFGRGLAIANLAYWALNLVAFLIPVALVRYMRAYFFCVEAAEVTTRKGMEETMGIVPNVFVP